MRVKVKRLTALFLSIITLFTSVELEVFTDKAKAASATVTFSGYAKSGQTSVGDFTIGGKKAYCLEHNDSTPSSGTVVTTSPVGTSTTKEQQLLKAYYYGPDGVEPWSGWSGKSSDYKTVVMSKVLSHIYSGTSVGTVAADYWNFLTSSSAMSSSSVPTSSAFTIKQGTTNANGKTYTYTGATTTATFTYSPTSVNCKTTFTVPTSLTAYVTHSGTRTSYAAGRTVTLYSGDTFYFTMPSGVSATKTITFTSGKSISATYYTPTNSNLQTLFVGAVNSSKSTTLTIRMADVRGTITFNKVDENGKAVAGAFYRVYYAKNGYPTVSAVANNDGTRNTITVTGGDVTDPTVAVFNSTAQSDVVVRSGYGTSTLGVQIGSIIGSTGLISNVGNSGLGTGFTLTNCPAGYYCIVEYAAPDGYKVSTTVHKVRITSGNPVVSVKATNIEIPVETDDTTNNTLSLMKYSQDEEITDGKSVYSMEGAEYSVYAYRGAPTNTGTNNYASIMGIVSNTSKSDYISENGNVDTSMLLDIGLNYVGKFTTDTDGIGRVTDINSNLEWLSGAYSAWNNNTNTTEIVNLPNNSIARNPADSTVYYYFIVETKLPTSGGYDWDSEIYVMGSSGGIVESYEPVVNDPISITINKTDDEGNVISPEESNISLEGTVFKVSYYDGYYSSKSELSGVTAERVWYIETRWNNTKGAYITELDTMFLADNYTSDEFYFNELELPTLPLGTVTIEEIQAAEGYVKDSGTVTDDSGTVYNDRMFIGQVRPADTEWGSALFGVNGSVENVSYTNELGLNITNSVERGNVSFSKLNYETNSGMSNVEFDISLLGTDENGEEVVIETHRVKTDKNGNYNSASDNSLWFYGTGDESLWDESNIDTSKGKLIYGTYLITEVKCDANIGFQLAEAVRVTVTADNQTVDAGTFVNIPNPSIKTEEWDKTTGTHLSYISDSVTVVDTVTYDNLTGGAFYTVKGILMELKDDGTVTPLLDDNGDYILAHTTFTSTEVAEGEPYNTSSGTVDVTFSFPAETLEGKVFVVYEYLFIEASEIDEQAITDLTVNADGTIDTSNVMVDNDGKLVCHTDPTDVNQTGYFPSITTTLKNNGGEYKGSATPFTDTVHLEGLIVGETYTVESKMYNATKNEFISDNVLGSTTFVATSQKMDVDVSFTADTLKLAGDKLVAYEYLYDSNGNLIISETDPNNTAQTDVVKDLPVLPSAGSHSSIIMLFISALFILMGIYSGAEYKTKQIKENNLSCVISRK